MINEKDVANVHTTETKVALMKNYIFSRMKRDLKQLRSNLFFSNCSKLIDITIVRQTLRQAHVGFRVPSWAKPVEPFSFHSHVSFGTYSALLRFVGY